MAEIFHLPKMGQTMTEGTILKWLKQEGDHVESWEGIVEMMTDKINMEVEPQITGTLRKILAPEGATVAVGGAVAIIGAPDEDISALLATLNGPAAAGAEAGAFTSESDPTERPARVNGGATAPATFSGTEEFPSVSPRAREAAAEGGVEWKSLSLSGSGFEGMIVERDVLSFLGAGGAAEAPPAKATPLAAKIAEEQGIPIAEVVGTGPGGRVTSRDIRQATAPRKPAVPSIQAREIPLQGMRRVIAGRLAASYQQAVHVPLRVDVDTTAAGELRKQLKPALEAQGARLTYTDLIAAAAAAALAEVPELNATLENDVIRVHAGVHLGIAVALEDGLTVPVIGDAHTLRLPELSLAIQDAASKARANRLPADAYAGGTFTITNLGQFGIDSFDPIINPPQVAILGVGRIQDRVVALDGAPAVRPMMTLTLTFDHRATDGAPASRLLAKIKELLENPARLLL